MGEWTRTRFWADIAEREWGNKMSDCVERGGGRRTESPETKKSC